MIGRIERTTGPRRRRAVAAVTLLALALSAWLGWGPSTLAQQGPGPRAKAGQVVPTRQQAEPGEPPDMPAPGGLPPLEAEATPKRDAKVIPAGPEPSPGDADGKDPLGPAKERPAGADGPAVSKEADDAKPGGFVIPADKLPPGKQRVMLSVEVQANPVINLGKESSVKLVVINESNSDAYGVSLVYQLPEGLEYASSNAGGTQDPVDKSHYYFRKDTLAAGSTWTVVLRVIAREARACEHTATVTAKAGSKASTTVQEPKLKVEAIAAPGRVLKGGQIKFEIAVSNPGSGPARDVNVQAKLSNGLRLGSDDLVEQTIKVIQPGERVELEPLMVDTVAKGPQSCVVEARSPDVNHLAEHRITRNVEVTAPNLVAKLSGEDARYTGQNIEYKLSVSNKDGTAPVKKVQVVAAMPAAGGRLARLPDGAKFDRASRKLIWKIDQIEPDQTVELPFTYATSTPGLYRASAEATAGELRATDQLSTDVSGLALLDLQVTQETRVIDVGKSTYYDLKIRNTGSKEATAIVVGGKLTNLRVLRHFGTGRDEFAFNEKTGEFKFITPIGRLAPGQEVTLSLEVEGIDQGPAGAHVSVGHPDMQANEKVEDVIATMVTGPNAKPKAK